MGNRGMGVGVRGRGLGCKEQSELGGFRRVLVSELGERAWARSLGPRPVRGEGYTAEKSAATGVAGGGCVYSMVPAPPYTHTPEFQVFVSGPASFLEVTGRSPN